MILTIEQQVCSLESAKRLKELGFPKESEFYWVLVRDKWVLWYWKEVQMDYLAEGKSREGYPAYTVAELGELLPKMVHGWPLHMEFYKGWLIYYKYKNILEKIDTWNMADTEAEARAKMLIYLAENGLLHKGES